MAENSVDAIVTDPPYFLGFMARDFDMQDDGHLDGQAAQRWHQRWATEALRILKPGGHLLAFGGTRTHHRLTCALEDAGFELRDCLMWLYGSGFPKSRAIDKDIDKMFGAERQVVGYKKGIGLEGRDGVSGYAYQQEYVPGVCMGGQQKQVDLPITAPATDAAKQWSGWGTALKPAFEPIILARKPLSEPTVAAQVLTTGTGALNIGACRIAGQPEPTRFDPAKHSHEGWRMDANGAETAARAALNGGRWPANVVFSHAPECVPCGTRHMKGITGGGMHLDGQGHNNVYGHQQGHAKVKTVGYADEDGQETVERWACVPECAVRILDGQGGVTTTGSHKPYVQKHPGWKNTSVVNTGHNTGDTGYASRFFYVAKASRSERGEGNNHPCVKPLALMRYLCRLITPPGGLILDPFAGSGTTLVAALQEGFNALGIEQDEGYVQIAQARVARALSETPGATLVISQPGVASTTVRSPQPVQLSLFG